MRRTRLAGVVVALFVLLAAAPAWAAFHLMKVVEVFPGTPASPNAQYIVIQMYAGGQNFVSGHAVRVYNAANVEIGTFTFVADVATGTNQAKILIATTQAEAFFGITPNLTMASILPVAGGKVCFDALDCVTWGSYSGSDGGTPFNGTAVPVAAQPNRGLVLGKAIKRRLDISGSPTNLDNADDTGVSSNDFVFATPAPRNNAGQNGVVPPATCGDGSLGGLEICDDSNTGSGDGCSAACIDEFCGDIVTNDTSETCDDGNLTSGDGCDANCTITACGNGVPTVGEDCDDGNLTDDDGCDSNCTPTGCGNAIPTTGEDCDDGNLTSGDGCDENCTPTGCGNGIVTTGEACEPPGSGACDEKCQLSCAAPDDCADTDPCTVNEHCEATGCVVDPIVTDDNEPCTVDSCDSTGVHHDAEADGVGCTLPSDPTATAICVAGLCGLSVCGDGYMDPNAPSGAEECDDHNTIDDDECTNACTLPACGDDVQQANEECDDGNTAADDGCSPACLEERCGDGEMQASEACDDGNVISNDGCSTSCALESCGDGVQQAAEQCDDGNTAAGDGCSDLCFTEEGPGPGPMDEGGGCCQTDARSGGAQTALLALAVLVVIGRRRSRPRARRRS
jgi:cysteine-rich repeat protein